MIIVEFSTFLWIIASVGMLWYLIPFGLWVLEVTACFIFRDNSIKLPSFIDLVGDTFDTSYYDEISHVIIGFIINGLLVIFVAIYSCVFGDIGLAISEQPPVDLGWLLILLIPHTIRFLVDMCKGTKYNPKSGELERISKLEKEIEELRGKK
ncbi:TMhelix containing protein [Vibrio phage 1.262.O._10N.286.51.A9]|nr:TMhelix containing protein [Vibrio phage 1.262.O._10N.286.51.A9]